MSKVALTEEETRQAIAQVLEKALNDANATILEVAGKSLPDVYGLSFVEGAAADQAASTSEGATGQLTEDDPRQAAGGWSPMQKQRLPLWDREAMVTVTLLASKTSIRSSGCHTAASGSDL